MYTDLAKLEVYVTYFQTAIFRRIQREGGGRVSRATPPPSGKSQVAIGFFRNTGTKTPREAIGRMAVFKTVKYVTKRCKDPH